MDIKRKGRKYQHLQLSAKQETPRQKAGWDDINFVHQALIDNNFDEIDTSVTLLGKRISMPLIINAITGGAPGLEKVNASLALTAKELGIGMAVGSQMAAINDYSMSYTYKVVRRVNPSGLIMANISALAKPVQAVQAVEMISADILQLHLNGVQELLMAEGDRNFKNVIYNIQEIAAISKVPVMVKEVGNGLSRETMLRLYQAGIFAVDTGGLGGTNFAEIELNRNPNNELDFFRSWGIPSACSLLEVAGLSLPITIMASGGINNALDMCKALAIGANVVGMAGHFLKILLKEGQKGLYYSIKGFEEQMKLIMMMMGAAKVEDLLQAPLVITGFTQKWCDQRNVNLKQYATRTN